MKRMKEMKFHEEFCEEYLKEFKQIQDQEEQNNALFKTHTFAKHGRMTQVVSFCLKQK